MTKYKILRKDIFLVDVEAESKEEALEKCYEEDQLLQDGAFVESFFEEETISGEPEENEGDTIEYNSEGNPTKCKKCGCSVFFADDTQTVLFINGNLIKTFDTSDLSNFSCVKCNHPEQYENNFEETEDGKT